jgi:hypothetical protein
MPSTRFNQRLIHDSRNADRPFRLRLTLPPRPLTPAEQAYEAKVAELQKRERLKSAALIRDLREYALSIRCGEHDAEQGEFCWRGPIRGLCRSRIKRGLMPWATSSPESPRHVTATPMWRAGFENEVEIRGSVDERAT